MYRKSAPARETGEPGASQGDGNSPRSRRASAAAAPCPYTSPPSSVRLAATVRPTCDMLLLHSRTSTRHARAATDHVRPRRFSCTGALLQLFVRLCYLIHARRATNGRTDAFCSVVCVCPCLRRASAARAAGQGDRRSGRCACPPWACTWPQTCVLAALGPCVQQLPARYVCESHRAR